MKHNLQKPGTSLRSIAAAFAFIGLVAQSNAAATMNIDIVFSDLGSVYQYNLTISNTGSEDIPLLTIEDVPFNENLIGTSLTAPAGFAKNYDPGVGAIDFAEDTSTFTSGGVFTGFSFQSAADPGTAFTMFSGFAENGDPVMFTTTLVPEPSGTMLALVGLTAFLAKRRR